jgi:hypothetical protein
MSPRVRVVLQVLLAGAAVIGLGFAFWRVAGEGGGQPRAVAAAADRARQLEERFESVENAIAELPQDSPTRRAAHVRIEMKLKALKAGALSKIKARLGSVPDELYKNISAELEEVEALIEQYPE